MKLLLILAIMCSFAGATEKIDLVGICQDRLQGLVVIDAGFCEEFLKSEIDSKTRDSLTTLSQKAADPTLCQDEPGPDNKDKWKIRFYASHSFTRYFNSDVTFKSTRYNIEVKNYEWAERSSREFFEPKTWKEPGNNPLQFIDEPTNTFVVSMEKNGHEFFLSAFHPKFLQAKDQVKHIKGTIDGVYVDEVAPINKPFDGYDQVPGESELVANLNTHLQMTFEVGYGYRMKLLDTKIGSLSYVPSVGMGIMVGKNTSVVIKENEWWDFDSHTDRLSVQGIGGSLTNRIELNSKKERFGIFYENKLGFYHQKHAFLDGSQEYNLGFMGNSAGIKFMIHHPRSKKK